MLTMLARLCGRYIWLPVVIAGLILIPVKAMAMPLEPRPQTDWSCTEDEALWWVDDDTRSCVNVEELVADIICRNPEKWYVERTACL